jgi:hypothetical protein
LKREGGQTDPTSLAVVAGHVAMLPPRRPGRRPGRLFAAGAVFVVAVIVTAPRFSSSGASADPSVTSGAVAPTAVASPAPATPGQVMPSPSTTQASEPTWTIDLIGQLECDGPPASIGGEVGEVYGEGLSPESPEAAMDALVANSIFSSLPVRGYERTDLEGHWARLVHRVDGNVKAVVVLRDAGPEIDPGVWSVTGLRACDPAEFAPDSGLTGGLLAVWLDADGERVPTTIIAEIQGPGHCGWESTIWLRLEDALYLRDPKGVLEQAAVGRFDPDVTLPKAARSTGYHEGGRSIWRDGDPDTIYVVMADRVERWPRALDRFMGCA